MIPAEEALALARISLRSAGLRDPNAGTRHGTPGQRLGCPSVSFGTTGVGRAVIGDSMLEELALYTRK